MLSTTVLVSLSLALLAAAFLLWAFFLRVGLHWAKVQDVSTRRVVFATFLVVIFQMTLMTVLYFAARAGKAPILIVAIVELATAVLMPCLVIMRRFKTSFLRSLLVWLPTLVSSVVVISVPLLLASPFFFRPFTSPTNAMAPTLLGNHWQGTCVKCGNPAFCSPIPPEYASSEAPLMICRDNFHVTQPTDYGDQVFNADRFYVAKFLRPQRWDLVVFRNPEDPSILYVMRLVGLPGEEITIKAGAVRANGEVLTLPEAIRGIRYLSEHPDWNQQLWGSTERPAKLADDEYFVLGDFSPQSKDSRFWEQGAPGHHPFAVPESHLFGVVTQIYWPPSRWRTFR